eukprot:TRINITY_DN6663_c0_g2_i1.p1 TRINITY_DN6663_c0_g2~~TRINITY_DN6663_c0_g2_i1.p1  ORF type:complete len:510 (-),score=64.70 TRINITY_DN6663_c0_g2_i1:208-1737(-)
MSSGDTVLEPEESCLANTVRDVQRGALLGSHFFGVWNNAASLPESAGEARDEPSCMGGSTKLSTLVTNKMDTLPSVRGALLQHVFQMTQGVRSDLHAHIQGRLEVSRKTYEHEHPLSVIRGIPDEVVVVYRSKIPALVQVILAEVQAASDDANGDHTRIKASTSVAALPRAIQGRLESCVVAVYVAMSRHVELVAKSLRSARISSQGFADVAVEVSHDVQHVLSAKVACAMQQCFEEAHQGAKSTSYSWEDTQTVPLAEIVPAHSQISIDTSEDVFGKVAQVKEVVENALPSKEFVNAPNDRALHSPSSPVHASIALHADSPMSSPGQINPDGSEVDRASPIASDMNTDADDSLYLPGSAGHPELCSRPCVFAAAGRCELGFSCRFCHLAHKKATHLDKQGRDALKRMTFEERVATILPLVRLKLVELQLDQDLLQDVSDILNTLQPLTFTSDVGKNVRKIQRATLTKFPLRFLFWTLSQTGSGIAPSALRASLDMLFDKIKREVARAL